jgi:hypothetical protein
MDAINNNPYRTLGLLAGASAKEQSRQINRLKKYIEAEQEPASDDFSFPMLGQLTRTIESIEDASSKLNLDSDKINAALFWFWNGNPITDEVAFDALKEGNMEEAYQLWDKLIVETKEDGKRFWRPVTEKNASAFHNHFVLEILRVKGNKHNAIVSNLYFLESEFSQKFISTIADSTYRTNSKELQISFLKDIKQEIEKGKINLKLSTFVSILNAVTFTAKADFLKSISQQFVSNISAHIETSKKRRTTNKANASKVGEELYQQTKNDLEQLKSVVGAQDFAYSGIADKVANEILQCSIDFFNYSQEIDANSDYHNIATKLTQIAENIAVGSLVKERIKESLGTLEEMKDREILQAIELLKSVKDAYETNKVKITTQVRIQEASLAWGQSINWSKVNEMIENSIAWEKVADLIKQTIPPRNVDKIKAVKNQAKINEYKSLVVFLMGKLGSWKKREIKYLEYWSIDVVGSTKPLTPNTSTNTYKPETNPSNNSNKKSWAEENTGCLVFLIIGAIILLIAMLSNANSSDDSRTNHTTNTNSYSSNSPSTYNPNNNHSNSYSDPVVIEKPVKVESQYRGNQLSNGSSPFDACFGKGVYNGNATLTIKNGSTSDAIVCLYSISQDRTIRNEYVRKNSNFTMDNIAQGYYKIRVFYGNDWNPTLENSCETKGNFESNVSFSEFDGTEYFEDGYDGYTVATVTLYTVSGGNASTSSISQSDFFRN